MDVAGEPVKNDRVLASGWSQGTCCTDSRLRLEWGRALSLGALDIWGWIILGCGIILSCALQDISSIPGLYPLEASSNPSQM